MKKSCRIMKLGVSLFLCLFMIVVSSHVVYANNSIDTRTNILPSKEWSINFSNNVDVDFVNSNYIYVYDIYGNAVNANLSVNPQNRKQVIVKPTGKYVLGKTYMLTVSKDFCDENGHKIGQDYKMQFSIKKQLVDTADFTVKVNPGMGLATVMFNSTTLSNVQTYRVEGQDAKDSNVNLGDEAVVFGSFQNVNVYFYDASGNQIGSCLVNIQKACDSQSVQINN